MSRICVFLCTSIILTACQSTPEKEGQVDYTVSAPVSVQAVDVPVIESLASNVDEPPSTEVTTSNKAVPSDVVEETPPEDPIIRNLLSLGNDALKRRALLTPEEDNANMYFQVILGRDPDNKDAKRGLSQIVSFYTDWAFRAAKLGQYTAAKKHMEAAKRVNADDPLIATTQQKIDDWHQGKRPQTQKKQVAKDKNSFYLPANLLTQEDEVVLQHLNPIIERVEREKLSLVIYWPTDKGARFLYQVINSHVDDFRVRGMIHLRNTHVIEVKPN